MNKNPSIKKNLAYSTIYQILILVTPFITAPYISRVLGADGVGIYSYSYSIITFFTLFAALGTQSYGAREIAQNRDDKKKTSKIFWEIEIMIFITSTVCLLVWLIISFANEEYKLYFIALIPFLIATPFDISWYYTGYEKIKYIVVRNTICKIISVLLIFLVIRDSGDLIYYFLINSLSMLIGNLSMWTYLPKMLEKVKINNISIKKHLKETIIYFIPTIATSIYTLLDKALIGVITHDNYENGFYEQATKIINIVKAVVFSAVNSVMGARISYLFAQNKIDEIKQRINRSISFIFLFGYGCMFGIIGVAKNFVPVFFGDGYEPVVNLLYLMSPLVIIIGISNCLGSQYYTPAGKRSLSAKFIVTGSCINLVLNLFFIPICGAMGATVASVIAEIVITILYLWFCDRFMTIQLLWKNSYKRILAGVLMLCSVVLIDSLTELSNVYTLILQIGIGVMIYGVILIILKDDMFFEALKILKSVKKNKTNNM